MPQDKHPIADQFSEPEMEGVRRYGEALGGVTPFDEEVEQHLAGHEANYAKMRAAQTGGSGLGLGPPPMEQKAVQQQGAISQAASTQGAAQAAEAQGTQVPTAPPPAPSGSLGVSEPYEAERGETPPGIPEAPGGQK